FNVIRSIISRLGKRAISLIPEPLILPKIIEESRSSSESTCLVDIGYGHTTVTIVENNEIRGFETFPYGSEMLMEMLSMLESNHSVLQIENIMCSPVAFHNDKYRECLEDFLSYIRDAIFGYLQSEHIDVTLENIFLHGNIFENSSITSSFTQLFHDALGYEPNTKHLHEIYRVKIAHDHCIITGLSLMANELLLVKKDPLVRILRYVLYQYE
ncbi:cell division FtsA domain-containing protein, partial [Candidatus Gracilibacteria bacterium]|nr:cell division FtsA domain-containing protein [Candidatus Gracilibacteria bacterium]